MQAHPLLHEALYGESRVTWLDADRGSGANAVEKSVAVMNYLHPEFREQLAVEGARRIELAHGQDDVRHAIDLDCHRSRPAPRRSTKSTQTPFGCQTASISARASVSS